MTGTAKIQVTPGREQQPEKLDSHARTIHRGCDGQDTEVEIQLRISHREDAAAVLTNIIANLKSLGFEGL